MKLFFLLLTCFITGFVTAQDINGIWRGHFSSSNSMSKLFNIEDRYRFEVQINQVSKKNFEGVTYSYKSTDFYAKASANGTFNPQTGKMMLIELKIIEVRNTAKSFVCSMTCMLQWSKSGDEEFLEGTFSSMNVDDSSYCGRGTVFLRKVDHSDFYPEPFIAKQKSKRNPFLGERKPGAKPAPNATAKDNKSLIKPQPLAPLAKTPEKELKPKMPGNIEKQTEEKDRNDDRITPPLIPPPLKSRLNEVVRTIVVHSRDITLNIYDNGTIDHDTVSVYVDNKLVVSRQMLRLQPIVVNLTLDDKSDYHEVVMVAENLGDIPPNTSLMVVKAGTETFEVHISSSEQKNAVVMFKYEKEK